MNTTLECNVMISFCSFVVTNEWFYLILNNKSTAEILHLIWFDEYKNSSYSFLMLLLNYSNYYNCTTYQLVIYRILTKIIQTRI